MSTTFGYWKGEVTICESSNWQGSEIGAIAWLFFLSVASYFTCPIRYFYMDTRLLFIYIYLLKKHVYSFNSQMHITCSWCLHFSREDALDDVWHYKLAIKDLCIYKAVYISIFFSKLRGCNFIAYHIFFIFIVCDHRQIVPNVATLPSWIKRATQEATRSIL